MDNILTKHSSFWICLALTLATTAVFWQVCTYDFIDWDDPFYVYENPNIQAGITLKTIKWAFTAGYASNWHPLTWLSHMLDWQLFGSETGGHHLTSLIFHIANTLLLFIVLKQMTHTLWPSALVAALFALHPLHVESVAWVTERKDVLSTFFWMLTMWAYVRFVRHPKAVNYLLIIVFFALGLMSKSMVVTLPFVLLLLDYWPLDRSSSKHRKTGLKYSLPYLLIEKIPLFAMTLASCIVTFIAQKKGGAMPAGENYNLPVRLANAFISYIQYIIKMIWPARLAMFYPHPGRNVSILYAVISAIFLLSVTIFILRFAKNRRYLVTGWFWYLGTLVPVIGLIQVGEQALADRYSYITLTGLFIIIAWGLPDLLTKWRYRRVALWVSSLVILSVLAILAHLQQQYWKNSITLGQHALKVTNDNYVAHASIADMLYEQGRLEEAIWHDTEAIRIRPDYFDAVHSLGLTLYKAGRIDEAIGYYKRALEINPSNVDVHINLGAALKAKGELTEAVKEYEKVLLVQPQNALARNNLGAVLFRQKKFDEAVKEYQKSLQIKPDDPDVLNALGLTLGQQNKLDEAVKYFTEALRIKPDFAAAHTNIGYAMTLQGNIDKAAVHFTEALRLDPNRAEAHYYLGQILAQKGKLDEAITHFEESLRLKPDWAEPMNDLAWLLAASKETAIHNPDKALRLVQRACELTNYSKPGLLDTLAVAYAAAGNFSKAIETTEKALELCQSSEQKTLKDEIENRLILYKAGKPYIEK